MTPTNGKPAVKPHENVIRIEFDINHPDDELEKYKGLFVAWSLDGRKVLASGKSPVECSEDVDRKQLDHNEYVLSYIDGPGDLPLG